MFDDPQSQPQGNVPSNLPIGEPEDMFAGTDPVSANSPLENAIPQVPAMPVDPVAPSALDAGVMKPKQQAIVEPLEEHVPVQVPEQIMPPEPVVPPEPMFGPKEPEVPSFVDTEHTSLEEPLIARTTQQIQDKISIQPSAPAYEPPAIAVPPQGAQDELYKIKEPSLSRGIMTVIIIIVVITILGGGGWWIYSSFIASPQTPETLFGEVQTTQTFPVEKETETSPLITGTKEIDAQSDDIGGTPAAARIEDDILFGQPIDSDGDGLDDLREEGLRTDPQNWDTDGDELSDGDEVIIWKTDPLERDTDGDTHIDGVEVKNGYNPAGPGRISKPAPVKEVTDVVDLSNCTNEDIITAMTTAMVTLEAQGYTLPVGFAEDMSLLQMPELWEDPEFYQKVLTEVSSGLITCAQITNS